MNRFRTSGLVLPLVAIFLLTIVSVGNTAAKEKFTKHFAQGMVNFYSTLAEYEKETGKTIDAFNGAPSLKDKVEQGELPSVEERISAEPMVMMPLEEIGKYGGILRGAATSPTTGGAESWTARTQPVLMICPDTQGVCPNVAQDWEFSDGYKTLTLHLREGMKWSDGAPFTADDFVFWYEAIFSNEKLLPVKPSAWEQLTGIEKVSDYVVALHFETPNPSIIDKLAYENRMYYQIPFAPRHFLERYHIDYNPDADKLGQEEGYDGWVGLFQYEYPDEVQQRWDPNVPTIDPWTMTRVDSQGNKYFGRNPYYWKIDPAGNQLPYIDQQNRPLFEDLEAITFKAIAGELDYVLQFTNMANFTLYKNNEDKGDYRTMIWNDGRGNVSLNMRLNLNHPDQVTRELFNDLRFRQAFSLALNREEMNEVIWRGFATPRAATIRPDVSFYEEWMGNYFTEYDPDRAKELLDEIGLTDKNGDGWRERSDGKKLTLDLQWVSLEGSRRQGVELIREYLEEVGIEVNTKLVDQSLYWQRVDANKQDLTIWNLDSTTEIGYHSSPLWLPYANDWEQWLNSGGKSGEEPPEDLQRYYDLAQQFKQEPIGTERYMEIGKELVTIHLENLWHIGVAGMTPKPCLLKNDLGNTTEEGTFIYSYRFWMIYHPEQWFWKNGA